MEPGCGLRQSGFQVPPFNRYVMLLWNGKTFLFMKNIVDIISLKGTWGPCTYFLVFKPDQYAEKTLFLQKAWA